MSWLTGWGKRRKITIPSNLIDPTSSFTDSSSVGHAISIYTGCSETKAASKFGGASCYFGQGGQIEYADHADWQMGGGSGNFTVDLWVNFSSTPASGGLYSWMGQYTSSTNRFQIGLQNSSGTLRLYAEAYNGAGVTILAVANWTPTTGVWYHVALVRNGNDYKWYVDGTQVGSTTTDTDNWPDTGGTFTIGAYVSTNYFHGYIDEFRISNTARWTSNFTAPAAEYSDDANTKLLLHFNGTNANLTNFPIALRIDASCGTGSSDLTDIFDDLGANKLKLAVTTSDGETQCYVEVALWDDSNEIASLFVKVPTVSGSSDTDLYIYWDATQSDNSTYVGVVGSTPGKAVWDDYFLGVYHLCETPAGAGSIKDSTQYLNHGGETNNPVLADGKLDKAFDFEKGDSDYVTLPGQTEATDDSGPHTHTVSFSGGGLVAHNTAKFGLCSLYCNATTGLYATVADHADWRLGSNGDGTGTWTVEGWMYLNSLPTSGGLRVLCSQRASSSSFWWCGFWNSSGTYKMKFEVYTGSYICQMILDFPEAPTTGAWHHILISRDSSNDMRGFWDGTQIGNAYNNNFTFPDIGAALGIGVYGSYYQDGFIDEFRISNNCRQSSNFTPPSSEYSSDANTLILLHFKPKTVSLKGAPKATLEALFTIESWLSSGVSGLLYESTSTSGYARIGLYVAYSSSNNNRLQGITRETATGGTATVTGPRNLALDTWFHGAVTIDADADKVALFSNGLEVSGNAAARANLYLSSVINAVGLGTAGTSYLDGMIDEARISCTKRTQGWVKATNDSLIDVLVAYSATESNVIEVNLGVAQVEVAAYALTAPAIGIVNLGAAGVVVGSPGISMIETGKANFQAAGVVLQALPLSMSLIAKTLLGVAGVRTIGQSISWKRIPLIGMEDIGAEGIEPIFTVSGTTPNIGTPTGIKPSFTASGSKPDTSALAIKPTAVWTSAEDQ